MASCAAVLWTGGKDGTLALCRAREAGTTIRCLVTFYPAGSSNPFKAHPLHQLSEIAKVANFQHELVPVQQPYKESYINGLKHLRDNWGIDSVITGDIDLVDGLPNWIRECTKDLGIKPLMPLWQSPREPLLRELVRRGIIARVSWINSPHIPFTWLGRVIDAEFISDIVTVAKATSIDICGENGEYHTMVERIPRSG